MDEPISIAERHPAKYWHRLDDGRIQCDLCPRDCKLHEGQRGACFVRGRVGEAMVLTTYGAFLGFLRRPDREKTAQPFLSGQQRVLVRHRGLQPRLQILPELGHLQIARSSTSSPTRPRPEAIARTAQKLGCKSVAFTYNDPVIFAEYAMDVADACHERGIKTVAVTAGYMHDQPRRDFYAKMDAANVDLKAFTDEFYVKLTGAHLQPVLDTLKYLKHETEVWFEITTLLIPGHNDSGRRDQQDVRVDRQGTRAWTCRCISPPSIPTTR